MHITSTFEENNPAKLLHIMQKNTFANLVTTDEKEIPVVTPLPF